MIVWRLVVAHTECSDDGSWTEPDSPGGRSGGGGGGANSPPRAGSPTHTPGRGGVNVPPEKKRMRGMLYWEIMKERGLVDRRDT